jgi:hypothetical protein
VESVFNSRQGQRFFCYRVEAGSGAEPASDQLVLSPGVRQQRREDDHSLPSSIGVNTTWSYSSTLPYNFRRYGLNEEKQFTAYLVPHRSSERLRLQDELELVCNVRNGSSYKNVTSHKILIS